MHFLNNHGSGPLQNPMKSSTSGKPRVSFDDSWREVIQQQTMEYEAWFSHVELMGSSRAHGFSPCRPGEMTRIFWGGGSDGLQDTT